MTKISHADFQSVLKQLVNLEEKEEELVHDLYPEPSPERTHFQKLLANYIKELNEFLEKLTVVEEEITLPLVLIESTVLAQELGSKENYTFHLVLPFQAGLCIEDVSILSPLGQALLLKRPGDEIEVKAPGGNFHYRILKIYFQEEQKEC